MKQHPKRKPKRAKRRPALLSWHGWATNKQEEFEALDHHGCLACSGRVDLLPEIAITSTDEQYRPSDTIMNGRKKKRITTSSSIDGKRKSSANWLTLKVGISRRTVIVNPCRTRVWERHVHGSEDNDMLPG